MSDMPSKVDVQVAVPSKSKKFFSQEHLTTTRLMCPRPIFCREYIPGRNMSVKASSFIKCQPLIAPAFGSFRVANRAFFVPFRTVMDDFNAFYTRTLYSYPSSAPAIPSIVPSFTNDTLCDVFLNNGIITLATPASSASYDIAFLDSANVLKYYFLTDQGVQYYTLIESLGYKINWNASDSSYMSALPLMCYAKIMIDWYYPSMYVGDSLYNTLDKIFRVPVNGQVFNAPNVLGLIQACVRCSYNPDPYVNVWDSPVAPNNGSLAEGNYSITDVTNNNNPQVVTNYQSGSISPGNANKPSNGTPFVGGSVTSSTTPSGVLTQYVVDALKSLTDYTKRHQLAGVRVLDRYLAELGISLSNEISKRSMYLGSDTFDLSFTDVMSHADTVNSSGGSPLGAYAGRGEQFNSKAFSFDNGKEFGMFIIVNTIVPNIGYYQGQHRETLHLSALDFYHADFDHMGVQAKSSREVYVSQGDNTSLKNPAINTQIFGFEPRYIEYNTPMDLQSGLYRVKSQSGLLPFYSLMRSLDFYETGVYTDIKHNFGFCVGNDADQYNRLFNVAKSNENLNCCHRFEVTYYDSTLPAYDTYDFDESNANVILDVNGSKLN